MAHLCALKRTAEFTDLQTSVWYGGLKSFPAWIVNKSSLALGVSSERFPEFGDLYQLCRRYAIQANLIKEPYSPNGGGEKAISGEEIATLGEALGLPTKP